MENSIITLQSIGQEILRTNFSTMFRVVRPSLMTRSFQTNDAPVGLADLLKKVATDNPTVSSIVKMPDEVAKLEINDLQNLEDISLLNSFASVAATSMIYNESEAKSFDFSNDGMTAYQEKYMKNYFRVMTQGLSGILSFEQSSTNTFERDFEPNSFHNNLLEKLFESFSLPAISLKHLDSVLNEISACLSSIKSTGKSVPSNYCVIYYFFTPVIGMETIKIPSLRIFNIQIEQMFVERAISKREKVNDFKFKMGYTDYQAKMDVSGMKSYRDNIRKYVETLTNLSLAEIMSIVQPAAIS